MTDFRPLQGVGGAAECGSMARRARPPRDHRRDVQRDVRRSLVVCSHPYDATFALGGIIAALVDAGAVVNVVCLTHDERGRVGERRRRARVGELAEAARFLGMDAGAVRDLHAGHVRWDDPVALADSLTALVGPVDALLAVDARSPGAHPDHVRAMRAALRAAAAVRRPLYGWVRRSRAITHAAGETSPELIPIDGDRDRQRAAIASHGLVPADDPIRSLPDVEGCRDFLTVIYTPPGEGGLVDSGARLAGITAR